MKILLDENIPRKLTDALRKLGHTVESVHTLRLDGTANGELDAKIMPDYELSLDNHRMPRHYQA